MGRRWWLLARERQIEQALADYFVAAALAAAGRPAGEREGPWYDANIKTHEYAGLAATARQIRSLGCAVVVCAPYSSQIRDLALCSQLVAAIGGPQVALIWVRCDPRTLRRRLVDSGAPHSEKLFAVPRFCRRRPAGPPIVAHHGIDNSGGDIEQLVHAATRFGLSSSPA